ncbi:MAG: hypothetical protein J6U92_06125 [Clostridia bacterium]|nr:hypothetical protein [Clostridia bacterium]
MDLIYLKEFLSNYSFSTLIIASVIAVVTLILDKFLSKKLSATLKTYIPFILSILVNVVYDMYFVINSFALRVESVYAGVLCGSLSAIIVSVINKIKKGEPIPLSATTLLIERILRGYLTKESATTTALILEKLFDRAETQNGDKITANDVSNAIKEQVSDQISENDLYHISTLIFHSVNEFKKSQS